MGQLISAEEACRLMNISKTSLYRLVNEGKLTAYKIRSRYKFEKENIHEFIQNQKKA